MNYRRDASNRWNSLRSTGPRSPEGKARSSQNSLRFPFLSRELLLPVEDPKALSKLRERIRDHFKPSGPVEQILAERIVNVLWRLGRVHRIESALLTGGFDDTEIVVTEPTMSEQPSFHPFVDDRDEFPTSVECEAVIIRSQRVSQELAGTFRREADTLLKLSQVEASLENAFYKALQELQRVQTQRRECEASARAARLKQEPSR